MDTDDTVMPAPVTTITETSVSMVTMAKSTITHTTRHYHHPRTQHSYHKKARHKHY